MKLPTEDVACSRNKSVPLQSQASTLEPLMPIAPPLPEAAPRLINYSPTAAQALRLLHQYPLRYNQDLTFAAGSVRIRTAARIFHATTRQEVVAQLHIHSNAVEEQIQRIGSSFNMGRKHSITPHDIVELWRVLVHYKQVQTCLRMLFKIITAANVLLTNGRCKSQFAIYDVAKIVEGITGRPFERRSLDARVFEIDDEASLEKESWLHLFAEEPEKARDLAMAEWREARKNRSKGPTVGKRMSKKNKVKKSSPSKAMGPWIDSD